jgi:hypothetical protein
MLNKPFALLVLLGAALACYGNEEQRLNPRGLSAESFLAYARQPFVQNAWGRFSGTVQHQGPAGRVKLPIYLAVMFQQDFMRAQIILDRTAYYGIMQVYYSAGLPNVTVDLPDKEPAVSLKELGIEPKDITFSFLYWKFERELAMEEVRGQDCRVMQLRHPDTGDHVTAWFSADYFFPLQVVSYESGEDTASRTLEFTDFKKHNDVWYVTKMRLQGPGWKTQVKFGDGEMHMSEESPPPPDLFFSPQEVPEGPRE